MRQNKVELITYADSLGGSLKALERLLEGPLRGVFTGLHILPPFPSSGDRGFAPIDYRRIDPAFGEWADITALSKRRDITLDLMVNHASRHSPMFADVLKNGQSSPHWGFFLTPEDVFGASPPTPEEEKLIVRRRARPTSDYQTAGGETLRFWTTFGASDPSEQIDLNVSAPAVRRYLAGLLRFFASQGVASVRLDAVGYVIKKRGTDCFMVRPEIDEFLSWIQREANAANVTLLCEVHAPRETEKRLTAAGLPGYDFQLPFAALHALITGKTSVLARVLEGRSDNLVTTLDCHDGVPVLPDMAGWISSRDANEVTRVCRERGARFTRILSGEHIPPGFPDIHQICGAYYSLLGEDDDRYIAARAIQLFLPGTPQIYYAGLLASSNDEAQRLAERDDRALNRHNYTESEALWALEKPVVGRLLRLIRLRQTHPAFQGAFSYTVEGDAALRMAWKNGGHACALRVDAARGVAQVTHTGE